MDVHMICTYNFRSVRHINTIALLLSIIIKKINQKRKNRHEKFQNGNKTINWIKDSTGRQDTRPRIYWWWEHWPYCTCHLNTNSSWWLWCNSSGLRAATFGWGQGGIPRSLWLLRGGWALHGPNQSWNGSQWPYRRRWGQPEAQRIK